MSSAGPAGDWLRELAPRGGPLLPAALAFIDWKCGGALPKGPDGIAQLAVVVDDFAHDADAPEEDDARFLDGAGSLLAHLLVEHLGGLGHRQREDEGRPVEHRIALGGRGFFDPFGAIDAALDADDPRAELRRRVAEAEAEARGVGPVSRVVTAFEEILRTRRPELLIVEQFGYGLSLGDGIDVDLGRAAAATSDQDEDAVLVACAKLVSMLPGGDDDSTGLTTWQEAQRRLLPRLVARSFVQELHERERGRLWCQDLGPDVVMTLLLSYPGRSRYVRADEVECWGVPDSVLEETWLARLAARSEQARFARVDTQGGAMVIARTGDGLDSARLLLPTLWGVLVEELSPPILAAVPHRDTLLAVSATEPSMVTALRARAEDDYRRAPHGISAQLFEVGPRGPRARG